MGNSEKMTNKNCKVMLKKNLENIRSPWNKNPKGINVCMAYIYSGLQNTYVKNTIWGSTEEDELKITQG